MMNIVIPSTKVRAARAFAVRAHGDQKYGDEFPYILHLTLVDGVLLRFGITDEDIRSGAYTHDTLEDTQATAEDIESLLGSRVTEMVAAVTEPKGGNRKWRHEMTYPRIVANPDARILKLADRIANLEAGGTKVSMYLQEHPDFRKALYREAAPQIEHEMWNYLSELVVQVSLRSTPTGVLVSEQRCRNCNALESDHWGDVICPTPTKSFFAK
jgi:(p)ppGpp synthase/HD superfamily hydrolase